MRLAIRRLTDADIPIAVSILDAAYGVAEDRTMLLQRYLSLQPDGWLLALLHDTPVGLVGAVQYEYFAYIGMMAVNPAVQRQGIGLALMERLLASLDSAGCSATLLDATEAGMPLYRRVGFSDIAPTCLYRAISFVPGSFPDARLRPFRHTDLPAVIGFDAPIFGVRRAVVLTTLLAAYPERAWVVYDDHQNLTGYVIAQERTIGPWAASSAADAKILLQAALSLPYADAPRVIVPATNLVAGPLLTCYGFQLQQVVRHMRRGTLPRSRPSADLYSQASFVIG